MMSWNDMTMCILYFFIHAYFVNVTPIFNMYIYLIKTYISNIVRKTHFWNDLPQVRSKLKDLKAK